jgi:hypothetical protein
MLNTKWYNLKDQSKINNKLNKNYVNYNRGQVIVAQMNEKKL